MFHDPPATAGGSDLLAQQLAIGNRQLAIGNESNLPNQLATKARRYQK
jgi:hypothetical protein